MRGAWILSATLLCACSASELELYVPSGLGATSVLLFRCPEQDHGRVYVVVDAARRVPRSMTRACLEPVAIAIGYDQIPEDLGLEIGAFEVDTSETNGAALPAVSAKLLVGRRDGSEWLWEQQQQAPAWVSELRLPRRCGCRSAETITRDTIRGDIPLALNTQVMTREGDDLWLAAISWTSTHTLDIVLHRVAQDGRVLASHVVARPGPTRVRSLLVAADGEMYIGTDLTWADGTNNIETVPSVWRGRPETGFEHVFTFPRGGSVRQLLELESGGRRHLLAATETRDSQLWPEAEHQGSLWIQDPSGAFEQIPDPPDGFRNESRQEGGMIALPDGKVLYVPDEAYYMAIVDPVARTMHAVSAPISPLPIADLELLGDGVIATLKRPSSVQLLAANGQPDAIFELDAIAFMSYCLAGTSADFWIGTSSQVYQVVGGCGLCPSVDALQTEAFSARAMVRFPSGRVAVGFRGDYRVYGADVKTPFWILP